MVELLIIVGVMMVTMLAYLQSFSQSLKLGETNRETAIAIAVTREAESNQPPTIGQEAKSGGPQHGRPSPDGRWQMTL